MLDQGPRGERSLIGAPPCGCIPRKELNKWRFKQLSNIIVKNATVASEIPLEYVEEYNKLGAGMYPWNSGKEVASILPDGKIIVGHHGLIGPRGGSLTRYYEYDETKCFPCERCKGKKPGEYGLED